MTTPKPPRAPSGLKPRARGVWRTITATYELDPGELVLLHELVRTVDLIDTLDRQLANDGLVVRGSRGQPRVHPLLAQMGVAQRTLSRLVGELALPSSEQMEQQRATIHELKWA